MKLYLALLGINVQANECDDGLDYNDAEGRCVDIDECLTTVTGCADNSCVNLYGADYGYYNCIECADGYEEDPTDPSKCKLSPPTCDDGYELNENDECIDIDECQITETGCSGSNCHNFEGYHLCTGCDDGYQLDPARNWDKCIRTVPTCDDGYELNDTDDACVDILSLIHI